MESNIVNETSDVQQFYAKNAVAFSATRHSVWDCVSQFIDSTPSESSILDAGCGNGKNMLYALAHTTRCNVVGFDSCLRFVDICNLERNLDVKHVDITSSCVRSTYHEGEFDRIMCIAVIHHLKSEIQRIQGIQTLIQLLKPNGQLLVTCWAYESDKYSNKREFKIGDNWVPFKQTHNANIQNTESKNTKRYYHIYDETAFTTFCRNITSTLCSSYVVNYETWWDKGNWNVIFTKVNGD